MKTKIILGLMVAAFMAQAVELAPGQMWRHVDITPFHTNTSDVKILEIKGGYVRLESVSPIYIGEVEELYTNTFEHKIPMFVNWWTILLKDGKPAAREDYHAPGGVDKEVMAYGTVTIRSNTIRYLTNIVIHGTESDPYIIRSCQDPDWSCQLIGEMTNTEWKTLQLIGTNDYQASFSVSNYFQITTWKSKTDKRLLSSTTNFLDILKRIVHPDWEFYSGTSWWPGDSYYTVYRDRNKHDNFYSVQDGETNYFSGTNIWDGFKKKK